MTVFVGAVILWLTGDLTHLPIAVVSLLVVVFLTLPGISVFKKGWKDIETNLEWGSIMLLIGGFALGTAAFDSGLAQWIAMHALTPMAGLPVELQPFVVTMLVAIDSMGFASINAAAAVNVPLVIAYAQQYGFPVASLAIAAGMASSTHYILVTESLCFILSYAAGYYTFKDLFKVGTIVTIFSAIAIAVGVVAFGLPAGTPIR